MGHFFDAHRAILFGSAPCIRLSKSLAALEKSAMFGGSSVAGADNAPAVERKF